MDIEDASKGPMASQLSQVVLKLEEIAKGHLRDGNLSPEDRTELEIAAREIKPAFDALANEVIIPFGGNNAERLELGHELVLRLLSVVMRIAGGAIFTDSLSDAFKKEKQTEQAGLARAAKLETQKPEIERRRGLLRNCKFNLEEIARSRKIADSIASEKKFVEACAEIGVRSVSGKQIQRDARDILKERR